MEMWQGSITKGLEKSMENCVQEVGDKVVFTAEACIGGAVGLWGVMEDEERA